MKRQMKQNHRGMLIKNHYQFPSFFQKYPAIAGFFIGLSRKQGKRKRPKGPNKIKVALR
jgi:hypothetical protein